MPRDRDQFEQGGRVLPDLRRAGERGRAATGEAVREVRRRRPQQKGRGQPLLLLRRERLGASLDKVR